MKVSNGLKHPVCGVLLPILNLIHVALVDTNFLSHSQTGQSLLQTQLCNDCSNGLLSCVGSTFDRTAHTSIIMWLTRFRSWGITKESTGMIHEDKPDIRYH